MRNKRNRAQYDNGETDKLKKKTTTNELHRSFDEFKAKFRNQVETVVDMVAGVAMLTVTMMVYVMLRIEQREGDNQFVKKVEHLVSLTLLARMN